MERPKGPSPEGPTAPAEADLHVGARYRALVEQLPAIVYLGEPGPDGGWLYVSPQIEPILGYSPEDWLAHPHPFASFVHPDDLPLARAAEEGGHERGERFSVEYRVRARDGRWVWILDEGVVVRDDRGADLVLQGLMTDVTERKRSEELLQDAFGREREAAQQLRSLDALKGTLLHTLSHDLRDPLTAIMTAAMTLDRLHDRMAPDERHEVLGTMMAKVRKVDRLLGDLLDLDRLDRGIVEPDRTPADLADLVRRVVGELDVPEDRAVEFDLTPAVVPVDGPKAERIVENLLANAFRHTPAGTQVSVRLRAEDGGALLVVEDRGPGVPDDLKTMIFEPFHRGPEPTVKGSGIGLSLVARFAELHGGRAWVEDRPGGGASFHVHLPGMT